MPEGLPYRKRFCELIAGFVKTNSTGNEAKLLLENNTLKRFFIKLPVGCRKGVFSGRDTLCRDNLILLNPAGRVASGEFRGKAGGFTGNEPRDFHRRLNQKTTLPFLDVATAHPT
ncbi:MAG: hypothetical protein ICV83_19895 [Cytophagales bacterium]|nr:hypothetical protein [Cytophagales bacterium]